MNPIHGDCLEEMKTLADNSVDLVLTDPPYGTTSCKWDSIIPLDAMWEQLERVAKADAAFVFTASQPFTTTLIASRIKKFKHHWIWNKVLPAGFQIAKYRPMMLHEDIVVFGKPKYRPIMTARETPLTTRGPSSFSESSPSAGRDDTLRTYAERYPTSIIEFCKDSTYDHPTQKPVALMEYLIKTYSNEGDTVLDFTMGSGTTGVAAKRTRREFIGIELDPDYFKIASDRIRLAECQDELFVEPPPVAPEQGDLL